MTERDGIKKSIRTAALTISVIYIIIGGLWILLSDTLLAALVGDPVLFLRLQMIKGWIYVAVTGALLYGLISRYLMILEHSREIMEESESKYRYLFNIEPDALVLVDVATLRITEANEAAVNLYGYSREELIGLELTEIAFDPEDTRQRVRNAKAGDVLKLPMIYNRKKDDDIFPVEVSAVFFYLRKRLMLYIAMRDITDRVKLENEREDYIRRLEAADKAKTDFVSRVSHELRTPLTMIIGYIDLLLGGRLGGLQSGQPEALQVIRRQATVLSELVEQILSLSSLDAGKLRVNLQATDIAKIAAEMIEGYTSRFERKGLYLKCDIVGQLPLVKADPRHLTEALDNLLDNALKFTEAGGVTVRIEASDGCARLEVIDTGIGLTNEDKKHLFERFYQAEPVLTRIHGGTGLGLALIKGLMEAGGASVVAESEGPGKGSKFIIRVPVYSEEQPHP